MEQWICGHRAVTLESHSVITRTKHNQTFIRKTMMQSARSFIHSAHWLLSVIRGAIGNLGASLGHVVGFELLSDIDQSLKQIAFPAPLVVVHLVPLHTSLAVHARDRHFALKPDLWRVVRIPRAALYAQRVDSLSNMASLVWDNGSIPIGKSGVLTAQADCDKDCILSVFLGVRVFALFGALEFVQQLEVARHTVFCGIDILRFLCHDVLLQ